MTALWKKALDAFQNIDGMLGLLDATVMTSILDYQHQNDIHGPMAEFGVYKGRSAALLASFIRDDEELFLVDVAPYLEGDKLDAINSHYTFLQMDSAKFIPDVLKGKPERRFRFIHADGSHTFDNVYEDVANADALLSNDGVFVIDDYYNPHYPQVAAAVFSYIEREDTDLHVFLVGSNKCYLCRRTYFMTLRKFILEDFQPFMLEGDVPVQLSKTDSHEKFDSFSFKGIPRDGSLDEYYATQLYGHFYKL